MISHTWFQPGSTPGLSLTLNLSRQTIQRRGKHFGVIWKYVTAQMSEAANGAVLKEEWLGQASSAPTSAPLSLLQTYSCTFLVRFRDQCIFAEVLYPAISPN